jgi:hypothetical protein
MLQSRNRIQNFPRKRNHKKMMRLHNAVQKYVESRQT